MPYHTIPYHTIPYHTAPHHTILYRTISYRIYTTQRRIGNHNTVHRPIRSCDATPCYCTAYSSFPNNIIIHHTPYTYTCFDVRRVHIFNTRYCLLMSSSRGYAAYILQRVVRFSTIFFYKFFRFFFLPA